ncbi:hypothetical protein PtA15_11A653 [Puccinia triticina]|uniref:Uncharacterized protein n=1 Tax=Puccinia triticina TaxID=208348 RepID=A0ABY7CXD2_9BASI|nr:uncharacterized protein PtA15_11A653 [Puccinia triticina]WAQ89961.1 hypothetical protein PtA15_11A653 [Puccinia triticina]
MTSMATKCVVVYNKTPRSSCMEFDGDFIPLLSSSQEPPSPSAEPPDYARCVRRVPGTSSLLCRSYTVNLRALNFIGNHLEVGVTYKAHGKVARGGNGLEFHYVDAVILDSPMENEFEIGEPVKISGTGTICDVKSYRSRFMGTAVITEVTVEHKEETAPLNPFLARYIIDESVIAGKIFGGNLTGAENQIED